MRNSRRRRHFFGHQKKTNNKNEKDFPRSGDTLRLLERPPVGGRSRLTVPLLWPAARKIGSKLGKTRYKKPVRRLLNYAEYPWNAPLALQNEDVPDWQFHYGPPEGPTRTSWNATVPQKSRISFQWERLLFFFCFFFVVLVGEALRSTTR